MRIVSILRLLWRHRFIVVMGLAFALPIGLLTSYSVKGGFPPKLESRQYESGIASAAVLLDSKRSQVADLGGGPANPADGSLSLRARLLANLMASNPLKEDIARAAGVRADWLIGHPPADSGVSGGKTPEDPSATITEDDPRASVLSLQVNETLPIITADVNAPDAATAKRIANASVTVLENHLKAKATSAAKPVPDSRQLVLSPLGTARSASETEGRGPLLGLALFLVVFGLWCASIVGVSALVRAWREEAAEGDYEGAGRPARAPRPPAETSERTAAPPLPATTPVAGTLRPEAPRGPEGQSPRAASTAPPVGALGGSIRELRERQERARRAG